MRSSQITRGVSSVPFPKSVTSAVAPVRLCVLRCAYGYERSGANDDADGCGGGAGDCGASGCWIFVGFLVSGVAEYGDSPAEARYSDAAGSAAGAWPDFGGESVCDAGLVSATGDTAVVWAA